VVIGPDQDTSGQTAPGDLEQVRELLNSWLVPNDTRRGTDRLGEYARDHGVREADIRQLRELRNDLRAAVEGAPEGTSRVNQWAVRLGLHPVITDGRIGFEHSGGQAGNILAIVLTAAADGQWRRLKACPDCRWVFYDHTRNASKRWCLMYAGGPDGRACGTIAKVRQYRQKQKASAATPSPISRLAPFPHVACLHHLEDADDPSLSQPIGVWILCALIVRIRRVSSRPLGQGNGCPK
jgi:predicted RNA-binding Zn ribbon-like protein